MPKNVFQKLIQQWDAIHPYNAAQLMRLRRPLDADAVSRAWSDLLLELKLAEGLPATQVALLDSDASLDDFLSAELNRPFEKGTSPFRPFAYAVKDSLNGECVIGLVYQHWLADSVSVRAILREWFFRMSEPARRRTSPMPVARDGYWRRFGPLRAHQQWNVVSAFWTAICWAANMKSCRRLRTGGSSDLSCRFTMRSLPRGIVPKLLRVARSRGVTVNDLFLAVIAQACDRHVAPATSSWRRHLALGTIVDLRARESIRVPRTSTPEPADEFGMYLGFTSVLCRDHHLKKFDALLQTIAVQNRNAKATCAERASMIRIASAVLIGKLVHGQKLVEWYRKRVPFVAGISNVNLNKTWIAAAHPFSVTQYIRVSPIGPMLPIVFTPSTLGDDLNFGLTWRSAIISEATAAQMADEFTAMLIELAASDSIPQSNDTSAPMHPPLRLARA